MVESMSKPERDAFIKRISRLRGSKLDEFFKDPKNNNAVDSALNAMANDMKHSSGRYKGKPRVSEISRLAGISKGGTVSDALRGRRPIAGRQRQNILSAWGKWRAATTNYEARGGKVSDLRVNRAGRITDNRGRFVKSR